ncbi:HCL [Lepeophtheirus salmonis]|uniref:HCL n=1 Tax=Lepeophtheirus salmonis TaxID=72036 RepID=A0A7R8CLR6_LEPSM|nr:HCL [Lepeophtheirus salmonis]CAF2830393.1 HCL [Lepeophtheirus salmonis]
MRLTINLIAKSRLTTSGIYSLITASVFRLLIISTVMAEISDLDYPLELSDIMPQNSKLYDKMRPPKYKGNATEVLFHVTVMSLDTIDESSMTYTCDVFFAQSWKDNRLRLPDNMTSEYRLLPIEWLEKIWRPDSFFKNAKSVTFQTMTIPNHYIWLWKDKTILYMVKLTLVLSCPMHFKNYPHDTQTCNLEIESISHTTDDLIFTWDKEMPLDVDKGIELPQLELISTKSDDCTTVYSTGQFTCLEVVFKFKRRLGYYLFHTYVPTCLIVIMSWISFWIKPEAVPARPKKSLPPVSYIKAIDVFMSGCTVFVFLSLMEYALVNIVMGDIADIEKKKSRGISNLILGTRGINVRSNLKGGQTASMMPAETIATKFGNDVSRDKSFSTFLPNSNSIGDNGNSVPPRPHLCSSPEPFSTKINHIDPYTGNPTGDSGYGDIPPVQNEPYFVSQESNGNGTDGGDISEYSNNSSSHPRINSHQPASPPPPPNGDIGGLHNNNVISQQGMKNLVHDVQLKRQKEIRDLMKKKT